MSLLFFVWSDLGKYLFNSNSFYLSQKQANAGFVKERGCDIEFQGSGASENARCRKGEVLRRKYTFIYFYNIVKISYVFSSHFLVKNMNLFFWTITHSSYLNGLIDYGQFLFYIIGGILCFVCLTFQKFHWYIMVTITFTVFVHGLVA